MIDFPLALLFGGKINNQTLFTVILWCSYLNLHRIATAQHFSLHVPVAGLEGRTALNTWKGNSDDQIVREYQRCTPAIKVFTKT